jgi:Flp pilus assembly pilin Flp
MLRQYILLESLVRNRRDEFMARRNERGATAVEYGLLVGLIAVAIIATLLLLGPKLNGLFAKVNSALPA